MIDFRVLIAEDEPLVARFLRQIVDSVEGVEVVSVCKSGEKACRYIQNSPVEILVTDIHLYGMTGLELIAAAKNKKSDIQVIIVSGYSLFEYAKEALRLGVEDYLLKPISPDELITSIEKMRDILLRQYNESTNQTLKRLLRAEKYDAIGNLIEAESFDVMFVNQSGDPESTLELCCNALAELDESNMNLALWNRSVLILSPSSGKAEVFRELCGWIRERAETNTLELLSTDRPIEKEEIAQLLPELYRISREDRILGKTVEHVISLDTVSSKTRRRTVSDFPDAVFSGKPVQMKEAYFRLFEDWEKEQFSIRELRAALFALLEQLNLHYSIADSLPNASDRIAECIKYADSFSQARNASWDIIEAVLHTSRSVQEDAKIDLKLLFEEIDLFLRNNCAQNYSLQKISQQFHVSQPYISRAFRIYANMTYKEYCVQQKIDLAKTLITAQPNKMFKDIAIQVGIDPAYFGTVFHRVTGEYPSEYKMKQEVGSE